MAEGFRVLVTGGSGLVGKALERAVSDSEQCEGFKWIFLSSKDADLTYGRPCSEVALVPEARVVFI